MKTFEELVEDFMKCDKRTLAEMLALREIGTLKIEEPYKPQPIVLPPSPQYLRDDVWCSTSTNRKREVN